MQDWRRYPCHPPARSRLLIDREVANVFINIATLFKEIEDVYGNCKIDWSSEFT